MGRRKDEAWALVDLLVPRGWKCRHCPKSYPSCSSVTRVKHHLAQTGRGGIASCTNVPDVVRERARHLLGTRASAVTARHTELPIQTNEIHQMQTQNHVSPTGSWQVQPVAVYQHPWENTVSYGTPQVQPVAVSHPVGEPNQDAGPQFPDDLSALLENFNGEGPGSFQM